MLPPTKEESIRTVKALLFALLLLAAEIFVADGFMNNFGKPYVETENGKISVIRESWLLNHKDTIIYKLDTELNSETVFNLSRNQYYSRPVGGVVDYISVGPDDSPSQFTSNKYSRHYVNDPKIFQEANQKFDEIKREMQVDELIKKFISG